MNEEARAEWLSFIPEPLKGHITTWREALEVHKVNNPRMLSHSRHCIDAFDAWLMEQSRETEAVALLTTHFWLGEWMADLLTLVPSTQEEPYPWPCATSDPNSALLMRLLTSVHDHRSDVERLLPTLDYFYQALLLRARRGCSLIVIIIIISRLTLIVRIFPDTYGVNARLVLHLLHSVRHVTNRLLQDWICLISHGSLEIDRSLPENEQIDIREAHKKLARDQDELRSQINYVWEHLWHRQSFLSRLHQLERLDPQVSSIYFTWVTMYLLMERGFPDTLPALQTTVFTPARAIAHQVPKTNEYAKHHIQTCIRRWNDAQTVHPPDLQLFCHGADEKIGS